MSRWLIVILLSLAATLAAQNAPATAKPQDAAAFVAEAETQLYDLSVKAGRAQWVQSTYITDDTESLAADANDRIIAATTEFATRANQYRDPRLDAILRRKLLLLKLSLPMPAPANAAERNELTRIATSLEADYGKGKFCIAGAAKPASAEKADQAASDCMDLTQAERLMATSRDPELLLKLWTGWHSIAPPMRPRYARFVELSNKGAREMGYPDTGAMWRSNYDMPPDAFAADVERLWQQLRPLYLSLHAYVRAQLVKQYGAKLVPPDGMIPAHLTGNMWAQEWNNIDSLVAPKQQTPSYDLTALLKARQMDELAMVRTGERFFTSLGFAPLPKSFWERSMFLKPADREVVCHASAWDIDGKDDVRLKMCINRTGEDFRTIHHELGHNFYQLAYQQQPYFFQNSANDGFHEAVGDTIALSVTPEYLKQIGLLDAAPPPSADIKLLLDRALEKIAFIPFGLVIDQWRWGVFNGTIQPADYNRAWWELRNKYQGVAAPVARTEQDFDPGAKYHVPANVPYIRYFLADVYQFQFHRALCRIAGYQGPLHRCSIYDNKVAGERLREMLEMGQSKPWPDAMYELTGERQADASAIMEYFAPLKQWLDEQNKGQKVGW